MRTKCALVEAVCVTLVFMLTQLVPVLLINAVRMEIAVMRTKSALAAYVLASLDTTQIMLELASKTKNAAPQTNAQPEVIPTKYATPEAVIASIRGSWELMVFALKPNAQTTRNATAPTQTKNALTDTALAKLVSGQIPPAHALQTSAQRTLTAKRTTPTRNVPIAVACARLVIT